MTGRTNFQLMRIFGIRVGVGASWFFVLFLFIAYVTPYFHNVLGGSRTTAYVVSVVSVLSFFLSLILHELGHALVARRNGLTVEGIDLWALGGLTRTGGEMKRPEAQFAVAAAGPAVTLLVALGALGIGALAVGSHRFWEIAWGTGSPVGVTPAAVWLSWLFTMNAAVLALNLIPAFPLDGGQIAQSVLWKVTGDRARATRATGRLGQGMALVAGLFGALLLGRGNTLGIWLLFVALFVWQGASAAVMQGSFGQRIAGVTVADIMDREPVTVPGDMTLLDAEEQFFLRYRWPWFAVVDAQHHFLGVVSNERISQEIQAGRPALAVSEALDEDGQGLRISEDQPLEALLRSDGLRRLGAMVAVDADGVLRGVVTVAAVRRALAPGAST